RGGDMKAALANGDGERVGRLLHNRLQAAAEELCPELVALRERLAALGPAGCLLSGSGTTMFALGRDHRDALRIAWTLRQALEFGPNSGWELFVVRSCS